MLGRRDLIALSAAQVVTTSLLLGAGRAQPPNGYPSKPVRVIVPVAAGGPTDIVARALADKLSAMWHQQVIIENKSGAATTSAANMSHAPIPMAIPCCSILAPCRQTPASTAS